MDSLTIRSNVVRRTDGDGSSHFEHTPYDDVYWKTQANRCHQIGVIYDTCDVESISVLLPGGLRLCAEDDDRDNS